MSGDAPAELPVTGYLSRFSGRPGDTLSAYVSVAAETPVRVRLERVVSGDPNPQGPGLLLEDLSARFERTVPGQRQPVLAGSYGIARQARPEPGGPRDAQGCTG